MTQLKLPKEQLIALRAQAHHLDPVVLLGSNGLTDAVKKEVSRALDAHGLIKVRVPGDEREERVEIYNALAEELGAAKIQLIGKLFVLFRPVPEKKTKDDQEKVAAKKPRKTGAKARNQRKRLTEKIQGQKKSAKSLPWEAKSMKKGKTPKGQVKAVGAKGRTLGSRMVNKGVAVRSKRTK